MPDDSLIATFPQLLGISGPEGQRRRSGPDPQRAASYRSTEGEPALVVRILVIEVVAQPKIGVAKRSELEADRSSAAGRKGPRLMWRLHPPTHRPLRRRGQPEGTLHQRGVACR